MNKSIKTIASYLIVATLGAFAALGIQCSNAAPGKAKLVSSIPVASAGITLATPIVQTESYVTVTGLMAQFGPTDDKTVARLVFAPSDVSGNPIPGLPKVPVVLTKTDIDAFNSASGSLRMRAYAALMAHDKTMMGSAK